MNLSRIEVIVITGFISLAVLLFGSWFLKYHMETQTVFSAIGLCFIGVLLVVFQNIWTTRHKSERRDQNKPSIDLKSTNDQDDQFLTSIIAEIENDETAINVLLAIKTLQDDNQEDSEVLGSPIHIPESEISEHADVSLGLTQYWIGKLTDVGFLKEGFGEVYGVAQPGLKFLIKRGRFKEIKDYIDTKNNSTYFPRLNLNILKEFAKRVVNKYPELPIIKVSLFRYHSTHEMQAKYALVFEVDSTVRRSSVLMDRFHFLQKATGWLDAIDDPDSSVDLGVDASFSDIYIDQPENGFIQEWCFFAKITDEDMPIGIMANEKSVLLFESIT